MIPQRDLSLLANRLYTEHAGVEIGHLIGAITEKSAFGKEILLASKAASSQKKLA